MGARDRKDGKLFIKFILSGSRVSRYENAHLSIYGSQSENNAGKGTLCQDIIWKRLALKLMTTREEDLLMKHLPKISDNARSLFYNQVLRYRYEFYSVEPLTQLIGN